MLVRSWIVVRILGSQALGAGGGEQILVGGNKGERRQAGGEILRVDNQRRRELNGIIPAQPVALGQPHRLFDQRRRPWNDLILSRTMEHQEIEQPVALIQCDTARSAVAGGHRGRDLDLGDLGDSDRMAGGGIGKRGYPRAPDLGQVAFDQPARVEIVGSHSFGPRISRMTSLSGLPPARSNIFRASSSERVDCAAISFISWLSSASKPAARSTARARSRSPVAAG